MLYSFFIQILNMSVIAVPMIITVMLFRLFVSRVPHKFICILWAVILFRLLCPFVIESEWSGVVTDPLFTAPAEPPGVIVSVETTEPLPENGGTLLAETGETVVTQSRNLQQKCRKMTGFRFWCSGLARISGQWGWQCLHSTALFR